jgi:hypothetical protein
MFLNVAESSFTKKPYGNNMHFRKCDLKHYAHNRFSRKVVWIFFL